ncbi:unnamed protein product [Vitrella brassicaformis CCMP3155]|uniref:Uncharacterized protein n=1 Tax=Vitrella brassicaformis (strain CCMP3155) TaxID=1169540 RepID=A0A0G4FLI8_VITBC|nr:unnamed protein product [Vitrella brassicaformis CCMP3155]|eukprot:CEM14870.1 unnamed protein product [Vitrella brassicaformis CCMP3155]
MESQVASLTMDQLIQEYSDEAAAKEVGELEGLTKKAIQKCHRSTAEFTAEVEKKKLTPQQVRDKYLNPRPKVAAFARSLSQEVVEKRRAHWQGQHHTHGIHMWPADENGVSSDDTAFNQGEQAAGFVINMLRKQVKDQSGPNGTEHVDVVLKEQFSVATLVPDNETVKATCSKCYDIKNFKWSGPWQIHLQPLRRPAATDAWEGLKKVLHVQPGLSAEEKRQGDFDDQQHLSENGHRMKKHPLIIAQVFLVFVWRLCCSVRGLRMVNGKATLVPDPEAESREETAADARREEASSTETQRERESARTTRASNPSLTLPE